MKKPTAQDWIKRLQAEEKAHEPFRTRAQKVVDRYEDEEKGGDSKFNILWSNVETLHPALYAKAPVPDIRRRYLDRDPAGKKASELAERAVSYCIDTYDFDSNLDIAIDDYLVPGIGIVRMRYEPYIEKKPGERVNLEERNKGYDELLNPIYGMFNGEDEVEEYETDDMGFAFMQGEPIEELVYEEVTLEPVNWKRFRWQPSARWEDVGWCAIEHYMDAEEIEEKGWPSDIPLNYSDKGQKAQPDEENQKALIYEIFDKKHRVVVIVADGYSEIVEENEDPLQLEGFYPFPRPLMATLQNGKFIPIPDYVFYQDQAGELDRQTTRINMLTEQLKYRGVYDAAIGELRQLANAEDGEFIPLTDTAALLSGNGQIDLKKAIATAPLDDIIRALGALHQSREETKQVIYEITGIADIMRGTSTASETLGAQQLKTQFGSMRLAKRQRKVAQFVRDIVRLKVEIMVENFDVSTLSMMTGIDIEEGDEVHSILTNDLLRSYRIDIETDSTISEDANQERQNRIDLVTAITGFFERVGPMIQAGLFPKNLATELLGFAVRGFKVGRTLEDVLDEMSDNDEDPRMRMMKEQFQQAEEQLKQQAMQYVEGVKQEAGKEIQGLQRKLFDAEKKAAITTAVNEARMFEINTKANVTKTTEKYKTDLDMALEMFKIQAQQETPTGRLDEIGEVLRQFAQIMAQQDQEYRSVFDTLQSQINEQKQFGGELMEWVKAPADVVRDDKGRVTGAQKRLKVVK